MKEKFSVIYPLAEAPAHIPTKEKMRYDNERLSLEEKYGDFLMDAVKRIIGGEF